MIATYILTYHNTKLITNVKNYSTRLKILVNFYYSLQVLRSNKLECWSLYFFRTVQYLGVRPGGLPGTNKLGCFSLALSISLIIGSRVRGLDFTWLPERCSTLTVAKIRLV
jgi:hypothetical protein